MRRILSVSLIVFLVLAGCGDGPAAKKDAKTSGRKAMALTVTSTAFKAGERIPEKYTGEGEDVSPPLAWTGVPEGTKELALICDDPDAPRPDAPGPEPWVHWVVYQIPAAATSLAEGQAGGGLEGMNSWPKPRYGGPMPPPGSGVHRYFFKLYALDAPLDLEAGATKKQLLAAMEGHILAQSELIGTYERK